jgi:glycine cleavage system aminomethyltransferase T
MKHSALFHHHRHAGATFTDYHGWELPSGFSNPETEAAHVEEFVGLADLSYRAKFETASAPPHNGWRLGEDRYLLIGEPPMTAPADAFEITSVYTNLLLAGPRSRDVMGKLTSLNTSEARLPNLACAQASMAHVHTIVLREDLLLEGKAPIPAYHLLVGRDYAESFWEAVAHAGEEFTLRGFGLKALAELRV